MSNYNTSEIKIKKLSKEDLQECQSIIQGIHDAGGHFIALNKNGNPIEKFKKLDRSSPDKILKGLVNTGFVGFLPGSLDFYLYEVYNPKCKLFNIKSQPDDLIKFKANGNAYYLFLGKAARSVPLIKHSDCNWTASCCRLIAQNDYVIVNGTILVKLAELLLEHKILIKHNDGEKSLVSLNSELKDRPYYKPLTEDDVKAKQRPYRNMDEEDMIKLANKVIVPEAKNVITALVREICIQRHEFIKAGSETKEDLIARIKPLVEILAAKSIKFTKKELTKIIDANFKFAQNNYKIKHDPPKHHLSILILNDLGYNTTEIANMVGKNQSTVSRTLNKYRDDNGQIFTLVKNKGI